MLRFVLPRVLRVTFMFFVFQNKEHEEHEGLTF